MPSKETSLRAMRTIRGALQLPWQDTNMQPLRAVRDRLRVLRQVLKVRRAYEAVSVLIRDCAGQQGQADATARRAGPCSMQKK